jgi:peptide/nickel transport system permease protein
MARKMSEATGMATEVKQKSRRHSLLVDLFIRLVKEKPLGTVGGIIVLVMFLTGIFADFLAPYGMNESHLAARLKPPSADFILGTDNLGRDQLSRIIHGARISMIVGLGVSGLAVLISTIIGLVSGFLGRKTDLIIQRFVDAWLCFPPLFIILTIMAMVGPGLVQVIVVLGVLYGVARSRIVRSAVIGIKENVYVEAAKAVGAPTKKILLRHILPNITAPIIVLFTVDMGAAILVEATMSFLGYGVPPPAPSWGGMISAEGRKFMLLSPWLALWPGLALAIAVYGINMLGDAMRDLLDPRLRGGLGQYSGAKVKMKKKRGKDTNQAPGS